jgi:hypothetical protein
MKIIAAIFAALIGAAIGFIAVAMVFCSIALVAQSAAMAYIAVLLALAAAFFLGYKFAKMALHEDSPRKNDFQRTYQANKKKE